MNYAYYGKNNVSIQGFKVFSGVGGHKKPRKNKFAFAITKAKNMCNMEIISWEACALIDEYSQQR